MSKPMMNYEMGVVNEDGTLGAHSDGIVSVEGPDADNTGRYDVTFKSGLFKETPVVVATPNSKVGASLGVPLVSTSGFTVDITGPSGGALNSAFNFLVVPFE